MGHALFDNGIGCGYGLHGLGGLRIAGIKVGVQSFGECFKLVTDLLLGRWRPDA
jgi:hypothetical protein